MDLSSLGSLGKIAGVAGIAIGMIVLLVRPMIERTSALPVAERAPTLRLLALGSFGIGALGIIAWLAAGSGSVTVTGGPCSVTTGGGNVSNNKVNCGTVTNSTETKP